MRTLADLEPVSRLDRSAISRESFPLSKQLSSKLAGLSKEVHSGSGVVVLRGLHAARFNDEEAVIAFVGVCAHTCAERATDSYANQTLSKKYRILKINHLY